MPNPKTEHLARLKAVTVTCNCEWCGDPFTISGWQQALGVDKCVLCRTLNKRQLANERQRNRIYIKRRHEEYERRIAELNGDWRKLNPEAYEQIRQARAIVTRNREIRADRAHGFSVAELSNCWNMSTRRIREILRE